VRRAASLVVSSFVAKETREGLGRGCPYQAHRLADDVNERLVCDCGWICDEEEAQRDVEEGHGCDDGARRDECHDGQRCFGIVKSGPRFALSQLPGTCLVSFANENAVGWSCFRDGGDEAEPCYAKLMFAL